MTSFIAAILAAVSRPAATESATRFIAACSRPSSASRLARSAASSALTITESKNASTGVRRTARAQSEPA